MSFNSSIPNFDTLDVAPLERAVFDHIYELQELGEHEAYRRIDVMLLFMRDIAQKNFQNGFDLFGTYKVSLQEMLLSDLTTAGLAAIDALVPAGTAALTISAIQGDGSDNISVTTTAAHGLTSGDSVTIAGTTTYDGGPFFAVVTGGSTFEYTDVGNANAGIVNAGTVTKTAPGGVATTTEQQIAADFILTSINSVVPDGVDEARVKDDIITYLYFALGKGFLDLVVDERIV